IEGHMSEKRRIHTYAVAEEARKLSQRYGADMEKAEIAALFHDFFRGIDKNKLNEYVGRFGLAPVYLNNANLAHGKIAARIMERDFHITDPDIINAVCFHTTGRADMSRLEKILYLADAIEPNRDYPGVGEIRELAYRDLDEACLAALERSIEYVKCKGQYLHQDTVNARDRLTQTMKVNDEWKNK
ncbi:MAG TPA: bis(5'-nucleosyl)-tetraphosphatase (symmetrical) YqeK, partial [Anaerovoracaceae bacterium]|nr:bis(5'-nucleosyl)-tetraphosphatase (symmetrical) YqeK [Anaerovoracaceae bacterium]